MEAAGLRVTDLVCARGGRTVLSGVSFALSSGEALILRGPNGSGKTTLLRTLAGLQPALSGRIEGGDDIAYGGHADGVKATLTVTENLSFWAGIYGAYNIKAALQAFRISDLSDRMGGNLSAGQRRRLALARLLVTGRRIWALDEPTVSLDAASVALFAAAIKVHLARGGIAVMATHIDLGLKARVLELTDLRAAAPAATPGFDEAFL